MARGHGRDRGADSRLAGKGLSRAREVGGEEGEVRQTGAGARVELTAANK